LGKRVLGILDNKYPKRGVKRIFVRSSRVLSLLQVAVYFLCKAVFLMLLPLISILDKIVL
jgi:hypothetical protein